MVKKIPNYLLLVLFFFGSLTVVGQVRLFSEVRVNKSEVYLGEAVELTISVYTTTFFTRGVDLGNIKVNGAFSVYFRAVSTSRRINGETYAGVDLIYNLFPFESGTLVIPAFDIEVQSPNPGDFKGVKRSLRTRERTITVAPPPLSVNPEEWLVTTSLSVSDNWGTLPSEIKVGEVLERMVQRRAAGTVSELIPPLLWDSLPGVGVYPTRATVRNDKSKTSISATRIEGVRYLFEREGEIVIPEQEILWWHPYQKKLYKRTLRGLTIKVLPNPDLEMLETAKSELEAGQQKNEEPAETGPFTLFGMDWKRFVLLFGSGIIIFYLLFRMGRWCWRYVRERYRIYRVSEKYAFRAFIRALRNGKSDDTLTSLYFWLDHLELPEPTLQAFADKTGMRELLPAVETLIQKQNNDTWKREFPDSGIWKKARRQFLIPKRQSEVSGSWINP